MTRCATCGFTSQEDTKFCRSCGASIDRQLQDSEVTQISPLPTAPATTPTPSYSAPSRPAPSPASAQAPTTSVPRAAAPTAPAPAWSSAGGTVPAGSGITLLPGERQLHHANFTPGMLTPHLKSELMLSEERLVVRHPTTIFVFFPAGFRISVAELGKIDQLNYGSILRSTHLLWGGLAAIFGLVSLVTGGGGVSVLFGLVLLAIGGFLLATARVNAIVAETGGGKLSVVGQGGERASLEDTAHQITLALRALRSQV